MYTTQHSKRRIITSHLIYSPFHSPETNSTPSDLIFPPFSLPHTLPRSILTYPHSILKSYNFFYLYFRTRRMVTTGTFQLIPVLRHTNNSCQPFYLHSFSLCQLDDESFQLLSADSKGVRTDFRQCTAKSGFSDHLRGSIIKICSNLIAIL